MYFHHIMVQTTTLKEKVDPYFGLTNEMKIILISFLEMLIIKEEIDISERVINSE